MRWICTAFLVLLTACSFEPSALDPSGGPSDGAVNVPDASGLTSIDASPPSIDATPPIDAIPPIDADISCEGVVATPIFFDTPVLGTTVGGTTVLDVPFDSDCSPSAAGPERVFRLDLVENIEYRYQVSTNFPETTFDDVLHFYLSCAMWADVCRDESSSGESITIRSMGPTSIYIVVDTFDDPETLGLEPGGNFKLLVTRLQISEE